MIKFRGIFKKKELKSQFSLQKVYVVFPSSEREICYMIAQHVSSKFSIQCDAVEYDALDKKKLKDIEKIFQEACILIVIYKGEFTLENSYKLGIAHAHKRKVVLVNLQPIQEEDNGKIRCFREVPKFIRYHFSILYKEEPRDQFLNELENIVSILLSGSLSKALYQKASDICNELENKNNCFVDMIDEVTFESELLKSDVDTMRFLSEMYIDDDEKLRSSLLYLVAKNKSNVFNFLRSRDSTKKISEDFMKIDRSYNNNYYFSGDQIVMGDKIDEIINNDLSGSNIDNFANQVKDSSSQQSS
jgi:hypothetical protein